MDLNRALQNNLCSFVYETKCEMFWQNEKPEPGCYFAQTLFSLDTSSIKNFWYTVLKRYNCLLYMMDLIEKYIKLNRDSRIKIENALIF